MILLSTVGKTKRVTLEDVEHEWQKEDWLPEESGYIRSYVVSDTSKGATPWTSDMVRRIWQEGTMC